MTKAIAIARLHDGYARLYRIQKSLRGRSGAAVMRDQQPIGLQRLTALQQVLLLGCFDIAGQ